MTPLHHQITESMTTAPGASDDGPVPIEISQRHPLTESEVVPATSVLKGRLGTLGWAALQLYP